MKSLELLLSELRSRQVQLWLEGDRLRYRAPEGRLSPDDLAELRDRKRELIEFLQDIKQCSSVEQSALQPVSRTGDLPLSFAQQRFWFLYQFEPDSPANNMPVVMRFTGNLNVDILKRSVAAIVRRHEILRSRFPMVEGKPVLVIDSELEVELHHVDLRAIPDAQREEEAHHRATEAARQPFDLEQGRLLRLTLFQLAEQNHLLLWNMPCIICDGTSSDLFYRELTTIYRALALNEPVVLPELPIQYVDFAHWQRQHLQGEVLESHLNYWKQQLNNPLTALPLPTDYPRPSGLRTCCGDRYARMLPKSLHQALLYLSQQLGTTLFVVLLSAFDILLHRYSQQDDVLTTFVSSGRNRIETENLIGFFSNTLILRTQFEPELTFRELVQRIHRQNLDAYAHQELPFERLIDALSPDQRQGRSPLFQTKFTLNPPWTNGQGMAAVVLPDLHIESLFGYIYHGKTKYDFILVTREQDQGLGAVIDYNAELFSAATIERAMDHFQMILENVVVDPDQAIATLPLLTAAEHRLLADWSRIKKDLTSILVGTELLEHLKQSGVAIEQWMTQVQSHVLDRHLQPVPIGVSGELYLSDKICNQDGLKLDSLPAGSLITNSSTHSSIQDLAVCLYPTGVTVRYLPSGELELASTSQSTDSNSIPNQSNVLDSSTRPISSPDRIEQALTEIWQSLLGIETISMRDNFFDLGGHSLLAVRLFTQIEEKFEQRLPLSTLLQAPTIEQLSAVLRQQEAEISWSPLVEIQTGDAEKLPLFCVHGGGFNVLVYRDLALNLGPDRPVYGLQAQGLHGRGGIKSNRLEDIAADYINEIRRVQPQGPYYLSGLSNGGNIALEMAQQLQTQGEQVALLAMFDSYGPDGITLLPPLPRLISSLGYALRYSLPRFGSRIREKGLGNLLQALKQQILSASQPSTTASDSEVRKLSSTKTLPFNHLHAYFAENWMNTISQRILEYSPWSFLTPATQLKSVEGSLSDTLRALEEEYSKIHKSYKLRPYSGKITLFLAQECPPGYKRDPALGWNKIATSGVEVYSIPGHHMSIMQSRILADCLKDCIDSTLRQENHQAEEA
ncbi:hypothetical protein HJG54_33020 [Leptolyngbya sp. NK1-12]|uniref:Carrier domain-containing protein n=1 Tax=Leptolyngbya sp. NK1-12 TaxID=2547451 RepID=A0AA96WZ91_9CYAN|nr:hypothetical protein HJG54_33020 [Leptolyngbya sp. NK1-12]